MFTLINSLSDAERWAYGFLFLALITWAGHIFAQWLNHRFAIRRENKRIVVASNVGVSNLEADAGPQKDETLHKILPLIAKYHSQEIPATPRKLAKELEIDEGIMLAHLWKYHNEQYMTFRTGGKQPDLDTSFFLSPKAWELIKIVKA